MAKKRDSERNRTLREKKMPQARKEDLVIKEIGDELLVYDLRDNKAFSLNKTVSFIWEKCDETSSIRSVVKQLEKNLKTDLDQKFVLLALQDLNRAGLIKSNLNKKEYPKLNRRVLLGKYALPALSLPVVLSLVVPTSAQMGSCLPTGATGCNVAPFCCPNNTCQAIVGPGGIITNQCVATP